MLEYHKNGRKISLHPIYHTGKVGQQVILDNVSFGENPDKEKYPLSVYALTTVFTIEEKKIKNGWEYSYILLDPSGYRVSVEIRNDGCPCGTSFLYDLEAWARFQRNSAKEHLARKDAKIALLESQNVMLKDILIKQGIRIVTEEQAKALGLS